MRVLERCSDGDGGGGAAVKVNTLVRYSTQLFGLLPQHGFNEFLEFFACWVNLPRDRKRNTHLTHITPSTTYTFFFAFEVANAYRTHSKAVPVYSLQSLRNAETHLGLATLVPLHSFLHACCFVFKVSKLFGTWSRSLPSQDNSQRQYRRGR